MERICENCIHSEKEYYEEPCSYCTKNFSEFIEHKSLEKEAVNHPTHYQGKYECIDEMRALFGDEAVKGFCMCNAYKYRYRAGKKQGEEYEKDIAKAEWYMEYLMRLNGYEEKM